MTRSVEELRLESERNRAALTATVEELKDRLSHTGDDLRQKVSPQHIKAEVSGYISDKTQGWLASLKQRAKDNPLQTVAAGTTVAIPMLRLARRFPLPLLMITAGLGLTSKTVRDRATDAAGPTMDKAGEMMTQAADGAQSLVDGVKGRLSSVQGHATELADDGRSAAGGVVEDMTARAATTASAFNDNIKSGVDAAKETVGRARAAAGDTIDTARDTVSAAPQKARHLIGDNAALIGGVGVAIGAIIAAALPKTEIEAKVIGGASDRVKETANNAAQSGLAAAKDKATATADAVAESVADSNLGGHASRMMKNITGSLNEAAEDAATAAINPPRTPNT